MCNFKYKCEMDKFLNCIKFVIFLDLVWKYVWWGGFGENLDVCL